MEDVVAVEVVTASGERHFVLTFGRIQSRVDPAHLEALVCSKASAFGLGDAVSARVCGSLQEAKEAPYFFEALIDFAAAMASKALSDDVETWRARIDREMQDGQHLYYLGDPDRGWTEPS